jgi:hypothetical protein
MNVNDGCVISSPIFLLVAIQACNLCKKMNPVMSLATLNLSDPSDEEFASEMRNEGFLLSYIETLPDELLALILERHPNYLLEHSFQADTDYYMSVCECGGYYGDHYVHQQISSMAFLEPNNLKIDKIPEDGTWVIPCQFSLNTSVTDFLKAQQ